MFIYIHTKYASFTYRNKFNIYYISHSSVLYTNTHHHYVLALPFEDIHSQIKWLMWSVSHTTRNLFSLHVLSKYWHAYCALLCNLIPIRLCVKSFQCNWHVAITSIENLMRQVYNRYINPIISNCFGWTIWEQFSWIYISCSLLIFNIHVSIFLFFVLCLSF